MKEFTNVAGNVTSFAGNVNFLFPSWISCTGAWFEGFGEILRNTFHPERVVSFKERFWEPLAESSSEGIGWDGRITPLRLLQLLGPNWLTRGANVTYDPKNKHNECPHYWLKTSLKLSNLSLISFISVLKSATVKEIPFGKSVWVLSWL